MWRLKNSCYFDDEFPFLNLVTTRLSGDMKDADARAKLCSLNAIDPGSIVFAEQVHGNSVAAVSAKDAGSSVKGADGLVTFEKGAALAIFTADCVPVFMGVQGKACGLAHAGWRGLHKKIIPEAVRVICSGCGADPEDIVALIGPHICPKCYGIGAEIREAFGLPPEQNYFDLGAEAERQLKSAGVKTVTAGEYCTFHGENNFYSYRKDRTASRIMSIVRF